MVDGGKFGGELSKGLGSRVSVVNWSRVVKVEG